jgi:hypothetical protein
MDEDNNKIFFGWQSQINWVGTAIRESAKEGKRALAAEVHLGF